MLQAKANIHFWLSILWAILMVAAYFVFFAIEAEFESFPAIYLLFAQTMSQPIVWMIFFLNMSTVFCFEMAIKYYYLVQAERIDDLYDEIVEETDPMKTSS